MVEYYLALKSRLVPEECAEYIYNIFSDRQAIKTSNRRYEDQWIVGCEFMSLTVYDELDQCITGKNMEYVLQLKYGCNYWKIWQTGE